MIKQRHDNHYNDIQHNDTQLNDTQHYELICNTQHEQQIVLLHSA